MSSATLLRVHLIPLSVSLIKTLNNIIPNTNPWGTPLITDLHPLSQWPLDATIQPIPHSLNRLPIKYISPQFREKSIMENQVKGYTEIQMDGIHGFSLAHWHRHSITGLLSTRKSPFQLPTDSALQPSAILLDFYCCENGQVAVSHLSMSSHWISSSFSYIKLAQKTGLDSFLKSVNHRNSRKCPYFELWELVVRLLQCPGKYLLSRCFWIYLLYLKKLSTHWIPYNISEPCPLIYACHPKQSSRTFSLLPLWTKQCTVLVTAVGLDTQHGSWHGEPGSPRKSSRSFTGGAKQVWPEVLGASILWV